MKLVTFINQNAQHLGLVRDGSVFDLTQAAAELNRGRLGAAAQATFQNVGKGAFTDMLSFLAAWDAEGERLEDLVSDIISLMAGGMGKVIAEQAVRLQSPLPRPSSLRDGYAFRQHVETMRRNRGMEMVPEFDKFPVFYYGNHQTVFGPGEFPVQQRHFDRLDYELEAAVVIGKAGRNIPAEKADQHIFGLMVMNDMSCRSWQQEEMKLSLGPAKGKDFGTVLGPYLVTLDELRDRIKPSKHGNCYSLEMKARLNGKTLSVGSLSAMTWSFGQIIEIASYGVTLVPGDVVGSGTVGGGCLAELNSSKITDNLWLKPGDRIELEIERLGILASQIVEVDEAYHS